MQRVIAFALISLAACSYCPAWECNKEETVAFQGHCFYRDDELEIIHAGPFCRQKNEECSLFEFYQSGSVSMKCPEGWQEEAIPYIQENDEETSSQETPSEETPSQETPSEETPSQETPSEETPSQETPSEETNSEETPSEQTTSEETPQEETNSEETPSEQTTSEETPQEETNSEETPSEQTTSEETPTEQTTYEETSAAEAGATLRRVLQTETTVWDLDSHISEQLRSVYCLKEDGSPIDWAEFLECSSYCTPIVRKLDTVKEKMSDLVEPTELDCDYQNFTLDRISNDRNFNPEGKYAWEECEGNDECKSGVCDCVPSRDHLGRCTVSYEDNIYEQFFQFSCSRPSHQDYWDNSCAYYILVRLSHYVNELTKNSVQLKCLHQYSDVTDFYNIIREVSEDVW